MEDITTKDLILLAMGSAGTILAAILRYALIYIREYSKTTPLIGEWHTYHWSRANYEPNFRYSKWVFKRSIFVLNIYTVEDHNKNLPYKGNISFEAGHVVITSEGTSHKETWHARLNDPIPHENTMMIGLELAQDFDREMFATVRLCSRAQKSHEEAKAILDKYAQLIDEEHCIRLRKQLNSHKTERSSGSVE